MKTIDEWLELTKKYLLDCKEDKRILLLKIQEDAYEQGKIDSVDVVSNCRTRNYFHNEHKRIMGLK